MKRLLTAAVVLALVATGCRDASGPSSEQHSGRAVIWFNGLSANADVWYYESDSLVGNAWVTGGAPNQIRELYDGRVAILSSLSADLIIFNSDTTGVIEDQILFENGSNPYSFDVEGTTGAAAKLLTSSVALFDLSEGVTGSIETRVNPSGTEIFGNSLFISYANWPDASSPGGISVYPLSGGAETAWLNTGVNTHWLKEQPTGMIHAYSTTYTDDGVISVVDPVNLTVVTQIQCGGAPGEAVYVNDEFLSPDGWGQGGLICYTESGSAISRIELPVTPTGLAISGDTLYVTSFAANKVYLFDVNGYTLFDSLSCSGEGPQGIIAVSPKR
ncbi:hypothetical protein CSA37_08415 [Candidatus Fermentibacteria bacterium]|nr:MAG: hypothetical protein CSA37_08415 [Candidatus Fermentibacteria bacterium]